jgi:choline dehydrogenase-like flavoprotein
VGLHFVTSELGHSESVIVGSSTFSTMSGFNPTLTIQALAYMSADAIVQNPEAPLWTTTSSVR